MKSLPLVLDAAQRQRIASLRERYRGMHEHPEGASPMIIMDVAVPGLPSWEERLADPLVMMEAQLEEMRPHVQLGDDRIPTLRVELGTGQVASAFGCEIVYPRDSYPAVGAAALLRADDVYSLARPSVQAGLYAKVEEFTRVFMESKPDGIAVQPPDLQGPFNCSHLIRGNDFLTDFFDDPRALDALLDAVTDYLIELVPHLRKMIGSEDGWFLDYGALWKGGARISNCSMQMISPAHYREHVLPRDSRLFGAIGGGRIHYCGSNGDVVADFLRIPGCTGVDFLGGLSWADTWKHLRGAPAHLVVLKDVAAGSEQMRQLLDGDWPPRRNIILKVGAGSRDEGCELLARLRASSARRWPGGGSS